MLHFLQRARTQVNAQSATVQIDRDEIKANKYLNTITTLCLPKQIYRPFCLITAKFILYKALLLGAASHHVQTSSKVFLTVVLQVDALRLRLEEKESFLNKKTKQLQDLTEEKGTLAGEIRDMKDMLEVKERKINVLQKKVRMRTGENLSRTYKMERRSKRHLWCYFLVNGKLCHVGGLTLCRIYDLK